MEIDPVKALDQLGATVAIVTVAAGERRNAMTATRVTCVAPVPVLVAVSVAKRRYTHDLIKEAGEFVVNVASSEQTDLAVKMGEVSGRQGDKLGRHGIETVPATRVKAPMIAGAASCMECKVVDAVTAGDFTVFIGEVVALHVYESATPLLRYLGQYRRLGESA